MRILSASGLGKYFGSVPVLENVNFRIDSGSKIGLIGANGAGKTTLIRLLLGFEAPSAGSVVRESGAVFGYVPQHNEFEPGLTVLDAVLENYHRAAAGLRELESMMADSDGGILEGVLLRYQESTEAFERLGGEALPDRARSMLDGLGLDGREGQEAATLSGGEKNVLAMAKALLGGPDMLVLDEPGNHLDYRGLAWLEQFLSQWRGAVLIVSHNRYLLDRVAGSILELEGGRITEYTGNYSDYRLHKLKHLVKQQSDYVANQKRIAQLEALVTRFREIASSTADPKWGKRLKARKTQLAREKSRAVERPEMRTRSVSIELSGEEPKSDIALELAGYSREFPGRTLLRDVSLRIGTGERVGFLGPNGSGKTTLLEDIVHRGSWDDQVIRVGPSMSVAYCSQDQGELDRDGTVLEAFMDLGAENRHRAFSILSRFLFTWEDMEKNVRSLSGGEKNRFLLAAAVLGKANFLVLDEPTNHLDVYTREAVEESLSEFPGTVLVVSHDRYFLDKIVDRIVEIDDTDLVEYDGNFSEFWAEKLRTGEARALPESRGKISTRRKERTGTTAGRSSDDGRRESLERRIMDMEAEKSRLERLITEAFESGDHQSGRRLSADLGEIGNQLDRLYDEWEEWGG